MTTTQGYSLWLMPEGDVYDRLADLITDLSRRSATPAFEPHVTLLGQVRLPEAEVLARAADLAAELSPYEIRLTTLHYLDEYFRCMFVRVAESEPVMAAKVKASARFGRTGDPPYRPHLSLMYGNLPPSTKEAIIVGIGREFDVAFTPGSLHVVSTQGEPREWRRVRQVALR